MWLADTNFPSEKNWEVENFQLLTMIFSENFLSLETFLERKWALTVIPCWSSVILLNSGHYRANSTGSSHMIYDHIVFKNIIPNTVILYVWGYAVVMLLWLVHNTNTQRFTKTGYQQIRLTKHIYIYIIWLCQQYFGKLCQLWYITCNIIKIDDV
jgi:hypothetical protein